MASRGSYGAHGDDHFRNFALSLEKAIDLVGRPDDEDAVDRQRVQIELMVQLEKKIRKVLVEHHWGDQVYRKFIEHICDERQNVLAARPYFRERQEVFTERISEAIKTRDHKTIQKFGFNYQFIHFALRCKPWRPRSQFVRLAQEHAAVRNEIVVINMPLAISRARIFYSRTPPSHLTYMDLVQISCEGLMAAVDKFCLPFAPVFPAVAIGRITGNFIEQYSETTLHFYPKDKRRLYRANKILGTTSDGVDFDRLAKQVNDSVDSGHKTNPAELSGLVAAASTVSADTPVDYKDSDSQTLVSRFVAPDSYRPDVAVEANEMMGKVAKEATQLPLLQKKVLVLKGVDLGML